MNSRLELHDSLCEIINIVEPDGDRHTYFQPPASIKMKYPAIVYQLKTIYNVSADDITYRYWPGYELTLIDKKPDSKYVTEILKLPYCKFDRFYVADNLNHWTFTLYNIKGGQ